MKSTSNTPVLIFLMIIFFLPQAIWAKTELEIGSILYHLEDLKKRRKREVGAYFRQLVLLNVSDYFVGYFKNSYKDDSFIFGFEKEFYKVKSTPLELRFKYTIGLVSGYCWENKSVRFYGKCSKRGKIQLAPFGRLGSKFFVNDHVSINLSYSAVITYATISYHF